MGRILEWLALMTVAPALACGCTVQAGLANAPQLGGTTIADPRVQDVIADGPDSCGKKLDPGPLRYRVIPCPRAGASSPRPAAPAPSADIDEVMRWVDHHYTDWGCVTRPYQLARCSL
jgi:hypothetical protein